ncbi:MAG: hypothetical protein K0S33_717 [Bacteroidetes bacterium]|jgi:hypothetical protein|nr:hypothetical protein [Bacteroidota bacterium]
MKHILLASALFVSLLFISCGGSKDQEALVAPKGMRYFDISKTGMNLNVLIPDSTKGTLDTVLQSWGAYEIKVGNNFQVSVLEDGGDAATKKADNANDDVNKVKGDYIINEPNTLMWESGVADLSEFHFFHSAKIGERTYVFEDIKGDPFTKEDIQQMLDACKQAKEIVKEKKD